MNKDLTEAEIVLKCEQNITKDHDVKGLEISSKAWKKYI